MAASMSPSFAKLGRRAARSIVQMATRQRGYERLSLISKPL